MARTKNKRRSSATAVDWKPKKKLKHEVLHKAEPEGTQLEHEAENARACCAPSVACFKFNKQRVRILSHCRDIPEECKGILYWMSRDQRVQDNWALLYAQYLAMKVESPLHVCFCLVPKFLDATARQYSFMLRGLQEVSKECQSLSIPFHLLLGEPQNVLPAFVKNNQFGCVITDFSPLKLPMQWVSDVKESLPCDVPFCQVDAHNIMPCWLASDKQEFISFTLRKKIFPKLAGFFTEFPPVIRHPYPPKMQAKKINWAAAKASLDIIKTVGEVDWAVPGTRAGFRQLQEFVEKRLEGYCQNRENPNEDGLSNLSPWLHFGQLSSQRCILMVMKYKEKYKDSVDSYVEEAFIKRELGENFCFYASSYDHLEGAKGWARDTLAKHSKDKREYLYTKQQFEDAATHDPLWNVAQRQMVEQGKMHGYLRSYWAKKILEWSPSPEEALATALYLNNKYELDGCDPLGYAGCMWAICGIHDWQWHERPIFGKIRYMNLQSCKRKFNVNAFLKKSIPQGKT